MLVSAKHRFVFFHVPKTGGSSITAAIADLCGHVNPLDLPQGKAFFGHGWQVGYHQASMHTRMSKVTLDPGIRACAFVRNPWSRALSIYRHFGKRHKTPLQFYKDWENVNARLCKPPQSHYLDRHESLFFTGRFEHLDSDFIEMLIKLGITRIPDLPRLNDHPDTPANHNTWRDAYKDNQELVDLVGSIFAEDARIWGYTPPAS